MVEILQDGKGNCAWLAEDEPCILFKLYLQLSLWEILVLARQFCEFMAQLLADATERSTMQIVTSSGKALSVQALAAGSHNNYQSAFWPEDVRVAGII